MNTNNPQTTLSDEQLTLFFDAKEAGKSFPDALRTMGDLTVSESDLSELHALWDMHGMLVRNAHNISPAQSLLSRSLDAIPTVVTGAQSPGYQGESASSAFLYITRNLNLIMNMNWKIAAPIAVVVIAVVAVTQMGKSEQPGDLAMSDPKVATTLSVNAEADAPMAKSMAMMNTAPVSGSVDDLVASLSAEADMDVTQFADASADIALVNADSQSINDLNTAYDETTF